MLGGGILSKNVENCHGVSLKILSHNSNSSMDNNPPGQWESCLPPTTLGLWFPEQLETDLATSGSQISTAQVPSLSFYCSANTSCIVFYFGQSFLSALWDLIFMFPGRSGVQGLPTVPRPQVVALSQRVLLERNSTSPYPPLVEQK